MLSDRTSSPLAEHSTVETHHSTLSDNYYLNVWATLYKFSSLLTMKLYEGCPGKYGYRLRHE